MAQQIVIGVDGSETSLDALAAAADLAEQTGAQLSVVFVREPGLAGAPTTNEQELESTARGRTFDALRDKRIEWTFDAANGDVTHELENVAQRRNAPLIIVGGRHRSAIEGTMPSSVAQKLVRDLPISVLVVNRPTPT